MPSKNINLAPEKLKKFFIRHLNRIYCAKLHLVHRLPEIADLAHFNDLQQAIAETIEEVKMQIARMRDII